MYYRYTYSSWKCHWVDIIVYNYTHVTGNYSVEFVYPDTGPKIQSIKSMWSQCKQLIRREQNYELQGIWYYSYLPELMWQNKFNIIYQNVLSILSIPFHNRIYFSSFIQKANGTSQTYFNTDPYLIQPNPST